MKLDKVLTTATPSLICALPWTEPRVLSDVSSELGLETKLKKSELDKKLGP